MIVNRATSGCVVVIGGGIIGLNIALALQELAVAIELTASLAPASPQVYGSLLVPSVF